jgi:hypothetical protein
MIFQVTPDVILTSLRKLKQTDLPQSIDRIPASQSQTLLDLPPSFTDNLFRYFQKDALVSNPVYIKVIIIESIRSHISLDPARILDLCFGAARIMNREFSASLIVRMAKKRCRSGCQIYNFIGFINDRTSNALP